MIGKRYGRLVVIEDSGERQSDGNIRYLCKCDCGVEKVINGASLRKGVTKSCGCLQKEMISKTGKRVISINQKKAWKESYVDGTDLRNIKDNGLAKDNTSGHKGVYWNKNKKKWEARLGLRGKNMFFGYHENKQDAINARKKAEKKYFEPILIKHGKEEWI